MDWSKNILNLSVALNFQKLTWKHKIKVGKKNSLIETAFREMWNRVFGIRIKSPANSVLSPISDSLKCEMP